MAPVTGLMRRRSLGKAYLEAREDPVTVTTSAATRTTTRGVLYVHSASSALCPHVEWAAGGVLGVQVSLSWTGQPAATGAYRSEVSRTRRLRANLTKSIS